MIDHCGTHSEEWMQEEDGAEGELDSNNNFIVQLVQAMPKLFETEAVSLK